MSSGHMLLDTSVLSAARGNAPEAKVRQFLLALPLGSIAIPMCSVFELERGARNLQHHDRQRAAGLLSWLDDLLSTDIFLPPVTVDIWRLYARMTLVPALRKFWVHNGDPPGMRFGCDPGVAAISIHYGMPIATRDVRDYLLINSFFPIPGLYDPHLGQWFVDPAPTWRATLQEDPSDHLAMH
ncbi:type II toxin-antitoxin system VapC family toxin [Neorhizobium tomejilense]|uniref:type II toxin-antitoxin system VapC family toxin n=1 Tax=Neorhizobium tomejilense TaxID=2093828 RepID=UPI00155E8E73|nr:type II toxin-antitoxin system VapC family toxin [Neorhizobium tomejilense]